MTEIIYGAAVVVFALYCDDDVDDDFSDSKMLTETAMVRRVQILTAEICIDLLNNSWL